METIGADARKEQVGMFLWGKVKGNAKELCDDVLYKAKVFIIPGFIFGSQGENYVRISLCCKEPQLEEALKRIKAAL